MIKCKYCEEPVHSKETGLCDKHHTRFKRHRSPHQIFGVDACMYGKTCSVCERPANVKSKGLCWQHYKQWQRHRNIPIVKPEKETIERKLCSVIGCKEEPVAFELCSIHYERRKEYRDDDVKHSFQKPRDHYVCTVKGCGGEHLARGLCARHLHSEYQKTDREELLNAYGHKCECCGETRSEFLSIDHKDRSGYKDRKNGLYSRRLFQWLKKRGYPKGNFRLLCHNCNQALGLYGYCPHQSIHNNEPVHSKDTGLYDIHQSRYNRDGSTHQRYGVDASMTYDKCRMCGRPADVPSKGLCYAHYNHPIDKLKWKRLSSPFCIVIGCEKKHQALGLCPMHLRRFNKYRDVNFVREFKSPRTYYTCTVGGCVRPHKAKGKCMYHLQKEYNRKLKEETFVAYGGKCVCCGELHLEFLAIDHIKGEGLKHRKELGGLHGIQFYAWLKRQGFPKDKYRLLCHNCNQALGLYGYCPHQTIQEQVERI